jgi:hypothetical protein
VNSIEISGNVEWHLRKKSEEIVTFSTWSGVRRNDSNYKKALLEQFEGTYKSNWYFLATAAASNLFTAANSTSKLIDIYERAKSQKQRPAETVFFMNLNYSFYLSGPVLGTILSTSAALEAFLRMCMRAHFEQNVPKPVRGRGTSAELLHKLQKFDAQPSMGKLEYAYRFVLERQVPKQIKKRFSALGKFRNDCFHGDPIVILTTGSDQTTRGDRIIEPFDLKRYPYLWNSNRPLSLSHAVRTVRVHDAIVRDLFLNPSSRLKLNSELHDGRSELNLIESQLPKSLSSRAVDELGHIWDDLIEGALESVPIEEMESLLLELQRKTNLHSVK